jgi:hypothetical protein
LRCWVIVFISCVIPIFKANKLHFPLPQQLVIDVFQIFLDDETCIQAFHRFIMYGRAKLSQSTYDHSKILE